LHNYWKHVNYNKHLLIYGAHVGNRVAELDGAHVLRLRN